MFAQIKITDWDIKICSFKEDLALVVGDCVIFKVDGILEYGDVINLLKDCKDENIEGEIYRIATDEDKDALPIKREMDEALEVCRVKIDENKLSMKLVGANYSFDRSKITFAFISSRRVDFRNLLKELNLYFKIFIKLYQIGVRDEARLIGDCGHCGRELCCKSFICNFSSINSEMAEDQQVSHRGNDRISGVCGRLLCCLNFEQKEYEMAIKELPKVGDEIKVDGENLKIISLNPLKRTVNVKKIDSKKCVSIIEIDPKTKKSPL